MFSRLKSGNFELKNEPRCRLVTIVDNELKAIVEAECGSNLIYVEQALELKAKPVHMDRRIGHNQRHSITTIYTPPTATVTSATIVKNEPSTSQVVFNSFSNLLSPEKSGSFVFDKAELFPSNPDANFVLTDIVVPPITDPTAKPDPNMLENKQSIIKKATRTKSRSEALYIVTTNSGNPVIQRIQRNRTRISTGIGSLSRMSRTLKTKIPETVTSKTIDQDEYFDAAFSVNKKSKTINTYSGEARSSSLSEFTGSLSDRFRLIDTTPTGNDPYQFGEADMQEQSPIPKLLQQKTNTERMKICSDSTFEVPETQKRFVLPYDQIKKNPEKPVIVSEPDLDFINTEPEIDWSIYNDTPKDDNVSLCDFAYSESSSNLVSILPSLNATECQELFAGTPLTLENLDELELEPTEKITLMKPKKRSRKSSNLSPGDEGETSGTKRKTESRRGRKAASGVGKTPKSQAKLKGSGKGKNKNFGKWRCTEQEVPGSRNDNQYHTLCIEYDNSWYFGTDSRFKLEELDPPADIKMPTIEEPADVFQPVIKIYYVDTPNAALPTGSIFDFT